MSKIINIFLLLLSVLTYTAANAPIINDCLNPGVTPTVLFELDIKKQGEFFKYQKETVRIPLDGFTPSPITCIKVINLSSDTEESSYSNILDGGVGFNYVLLHFKSERGKGYHFHVIIYYDAAD